MGKVANNFAKGNNKTFFYFILNGSLAAFVVKSLMKLAIQVS